NPTLLAPNGSIARPPGARLAPNMRMSRASRTVTSGRAGSYLSMMGRRMLLLIGLGLLAVAGCGPLHPLAAASTPAGTIPWKALAADLTPMPVPSPLALPVPPGTPACTAGELAGAAVGSQGATGHVL